MKLRPAYLLLLSLFFIKGFGTPVRSSLSERAVFLQQVSTAGNENASFYDASDTGMRLPDLSLFNDSDDNEDNEDFSCAGNATGPVAFCSSEEIVYSKGFLLHAFAHAKPAAKPFFCSYPETFLRNRVIRI
ncbi:MAG: hypothetical protein QM687_08865 [Ferruginibacter sp.]